MNFKEFQDKWTPRINTYLQTQLSQEITDPKIAQIMAYSVLAGGKRLRPLLFLAALTTLDQKIDQDQLRTACGIELVHTYSLIHDDLPAMDNDSYRRGKLSSHKKWGEAEAILAGDGLLPLGLQWIAEGSKELKLVEIMTKAIGPNGMVGGQYLDIDSTNNQSVAGDKQFVNRMEWLKTGCLIQATVEMAAVAGKANSEQKEKLLAFARAFGRAYQIYDDLVDVVETSAEAGKATHKDKEEGKNNTVTVLGLEKSREQLRHLINDAKQALTAFACPLLAGFLNLYQKVL